MHENNNGTPSVKTWLLLFAGMLLVLTAIALLIPNLSGSRASNRAVITVDNAPVRTLDLSEDARFTLETAHGTNTITVSDGRISVTDADCPDHVCVLHGPLTVNGLPIICLPHHLVIRFEKSSSDVDAIAQ